MRISTAHFETIFAYSEEKMFDKLAGFKCTCVKIVPFLSENMWDVKVERIY